MVTRNLTIPLIHTYLHISAIYIKLVIPFALRSCLFGSCVRITETIPVGLTSRIASKLVYDHVVLPLPFCGDEHPVSWKTRWPEGCSGGDSRELPLSVNGLTGQILRAQGLFDERQFVYR